jgi:hypothetical protein
MEDLQKFIDGYKENLKNYEESLAKEYQRKSNGVKAYYRIIEEQIDKILSQNDKLVFKIDDDIYLLYLNKSTGAYVIYPNKDIHWFTIEGIGFSMKRGCLMSRFDIDKHLKFEIVTYSEFLEKLDEFKKKNYNPDDENVEFQFHNGIPYRDSDVMERHMEYFQDEYIKEFYIKLNNYEDELYEEM